MSFDEIITNIENIVSEIAEPALWSEQPQEKRTAFAKCAFYDITAYALSVGININPIDTIFQRAAAEQTLHIAKQIFVEKNGLVISEENINGLGSRRYKLPDPSTIAARSRMYIDNFAKQNKMIRTVR